MAVLLSEGCEKDRLTRRRRRSKLELKRMQSSLPRADFATGARMIERPVWPRRARRLLSRCALLVLVAVLVAGCGSASGTTSTVSTGPYQLVFSDDFNGAANTGVNTNNWIYDLGTGYPGGPPNWGTGEVEVMTD